MRRILNLLICAVFCLATSAFATSTEVRLLLSADSARPGDTVMAGIKLQMQPGWHTYWRNPGDSGLATKIKWDLPPGVTAGETQWPVPEKLIISPLTTYVYSGEAILLIPLKIAADVQPGPIDIKAKVSWQECAEQCILGNADISRPLVIGGASTPSPDAALLESAKASLPKTEPKPIVQARWGNVEDNRSLTVDWNVAGKPAEVDFFPYDSDKYEVKGETERLSDRDGKVQIRKLVSKSEGDWPASIPGLLISKTTKDSPPQAYEANLSPSAFTAASNDPTAFPSSAANKSLLVMLGFAFLGGLILNIMPCVLPVIALKILSFVNQAKEAPGRVRLFGITYGFGVLISFFVLAGVAIAVQRAGGSASWSTAFQNPQFRVIMTILITLVALNLFGVFEVTLSGRAMGAASELTNKHGFAGAFFNGILAALLATPCTAAFLAPAMAYAFTQPPAIIVLFFIAAGLGLAMPYILLCWNPAWLKFLPKPGLWMQRFKVAMGFPMLATAVWLFWITAPRLGKSGVLWFGLFLVILAMAAWIWGEFVQRGSKGAGLAMLISLLFVASGYGFILERQIHWRTPNFVAKDAINWQVWSPQAVEKARSEGHPVLVDFTADSCLNCQLNLIRSIDIPETRDKLKEIKAVTLTADNTDPDAAIARELKRFDRPGVPLVLVYPANKDLPPIVLPAGLFSPSVMLDALNRSVQTSTTASSASNN